MISDFPSTLSISFKVCFRYVSSWLMLLLFIFSSAGGDKPRKTSSRRAIKDLVKDACSDVQNCFGFDEEGEDEEMEEELTQD